ncbi:hypothetical protein ZOD2009_16468 [Haladaptatus paucihalophilus DX253]|uniref:Uncharacterized protein n=1 Tax=Haladaptatus paucihalophilus DX253 TaxID=797209 RepID=E7QWV5_HALPU|nr:hypothetical protein [Haladaptatus paucihalophilus]EFW90758.1 hypothetical protein ZOD2009_16468 [Haladaptatus paucihalophilus DX253]SHK21580.1 hypothetical protein SAMN05444342_0975 [Haladaptatus paucihalophilus DX253]
MKNRTAALAGVILGSLPVAVLYADGYWDVQLAAVIWGIYALGGWLILRQEDIWRTGGNRWSALLVVVAMGGSQFGVHMDLPISERLTIALWFLVLGVAFAAAAIGVEMAETTDGQASEQDSYVPSAD